MAPYLNLAVLTGEELERLLGVDAAQKLLPELSRARMEGKPYRGPAIPEVVRYERLATHEAEREWGATAEHTRRLRALRESFLALGFKEHGVLYAPELLGARHHCALTGDVDTAAALRWSETLNEHAQPPYLQLLTMLRDRASGFAAVLTLTAAAPPTPALSEEVALRHLPGADAMETRAAHRAEVLRHGRGVKLTSLEEWERTWLALRHLNHAAWTRRGVLLEPVKGEK